MVAPFTGYERGHVEPDIDDPLQYVAMGVPYDSGALVLRRLLDLGLRQHHYVLDVGAGSLRVGRFLITLLERYHYYAIEPQDWLFDAGLKLMGSGIEDVKGVTRSDNSDFNLDVFAPQQFDYILISSIIMHQSHAQMKKTFDTAAKALAPGGMIVADYRDAGQRRDYTGEEWLYPNLAWHMQTCLEEACDERWKYEELDREIYGALWFKMGGKE